MQNRLKIAISVTGFIEWTGGINFLKGIIDLLLNNDNDFYLLLPSFSLKNYPKFLVKNFKSLLKLYNQIFPAKENPEMEELFKEFKGKVKFVYHNGNIVKAINKIKPDIIYPTWDKIYNKCKIPQIAYLYDCQHRYFPEYFKKHSIESRDKYFQSVVDNYKAIIVGSLDAKNDLIKFYGAKPEQIFDIFSSPLLNENLLDEIKTDVIEKYQSLIWSIVNKYRTYFDKDDLFQVGVIGLINAYKNFKETKNTKFSSYAYFYIFGEIKKYIYESNFFKVSKELVKINTLVEKAKVLLSQKLQKEPTYFELSLYLEIPEEKIYEAQEANSLLESLDCTLENDFSLYDNISTSFNEKMIDPEILDLKYEIDKLDDFSKEIINNRYNLDKSQVETAKDMGLTQVMVSRKEKEILQRLRTRLS